MYIHIYEIWIVYLLTMCFLDNTEPCDVRLCLVCILVTTFSLANFLATFLIDFI